MRAIAGPSFDTPLSEATQDVYIYEYTISYNFKFLLLVKFAILSYSDPMGKYLINI